MSSEGSLTTSTSSRIRQFGLYRSIDARTEEFLKLSKKRQLRQGCACAVISTLITVTVVVCVLLIYEYGINSAWTPSHIKTSARFGLINGTDPMAFEEKFIKTYKNFDPATLKLLPIIIKALKQNRYLEKIMEEYTSSSPKYEENPATEFIYKRNIFSDLKSIKSPSSRLYTVAYKTFPISFTRNINRSQDYYNKFRNIRDYKRITNYIHKIKKENVGPDHTQFLKNEDYHRRMENERNNGTTLQKPSCKCNASRKVHQSKNNTNRTIKKSSNHLTLKLLKKKPIQIRTNSSYDILTNKILALNTSTVCRCPSYLDNLLNKLQASVQQLISDSKNSKILQHCLDSNPKIKILSNNEPKLFISTPTSRLPFEMTKIKNNILIPKPYIPFINHFTPNPIGPYSPIVNHFTSKSIGKKTLGDFGKNVMNHNEQADRNITKHISELSNISSAIKPNTESINPTPNFIKTSKPQVSTFLPVIKRTPKEKINDSSTTYKPNIVTTTQYYNQLTKLKQHPKKTMFGNYIIFPVIESDIKNSHHTNWPLFNPNINKNAMEVNDNVKPTISPVMEDDFNEQNIAMKYLKDDIGQLDVKHSLNSSSQAHLKILDTIDENRFNDVIVTANQNITSTIAVITDRDVVLASEENSSFHINPEYTSETEDFTSLKMENITSNLINPLPYNATMLHDDNYKIYTDYDYYDDASPVPTSNITKSISFHRNSGTQSMLPQSRPTYLKVQRSDWKHEELPDYNSIT